MGGGTPLIVNIEYDQAIDDVIFDKTWQEIYDAFPNVCCQFGESRYGVIYVTPNDYQVYVFNESSFDRFCATTATDYPTTCVSS